MVGHWGTVVYRSLWVMLSRKHFEVEPPIIWLLTLCCNHWSTAATLGLGDARFHPFHNMLVQITVISPLRPFQQLLHVDIMSMKIINRFGTINKWEECWNNSHCIHTETRSLKALTHIPHFHVVAPNTKAHDAHDHGHSTNVGWISIFLSHLRKLYKSKELVHCVQVPQWSSWINN